MFSIVTTQAKKTKQNNINNIKKKNIIQDFFLPYNHSYSFVWNTDIKVSWKLKRRLIAAYVFCFNTVRLLSAFASLIRCDLYYIIAYSALFPLLKPNEITKLILFHIQQCFRMELISLYPNSSKMGNGGREEEGSRDKENKTVLWFEPEGLHASSLKGVILSEQPKNCFPLHYAVLTQGSEDTMPE